MGRFCAARDLLASALTTVSQPGRRCAEGRCARHDDHKQVELGSRVRELVDRLAFESQAFERRTLAHSSGGLRTVVLRPFRHVRRLSDGTGVHLLAGAAAGIGDRVDVIREVRNDAVAC